MNPDTLYRICQLIIALLTIAVLAAIVKGLRLGLSDFSSRNSKMLVQFVIGGMICWLTILAILAAAGFFTNFESLPPRMLICILPPMALIFILLFSPAFMAVLKQLPLSWLVWIQVFRVGVEAMLWLGYKAGFVPPQMTLEWLNQDIIVGLTAPMAANIFFRKGHFRRFEALIWNIFGIALLLNIVTIAFISTPSPWRIFMNEPANTFIVTMPFIWIPGFLVPFALAAHLFSIRQILLIPKEKKRRFGETF